MSQLGPSKISRRFVAQVDALLQRGAVEAAVDICAQGVQAFPDFVPGWVLMARGFLEQGLFSEAEGWISRLREDYPHHRGGVALERELQRRMPPPAVEEAPPPAQAFLLPGVEAVRGLLDLGGPGGLMDPLPAPEAPSEDEEGGFNILSETLADLYAKQGDIGAAKDMYRRLIDAGASDPAIHQKLAALHDDEPGGETARIHALEDWLDAFEIED